ncbi:hypothetical protein [Flavobacterium subsaxonicum]|uniref:Uncharacterized protein n=1 Tax=Flavobacterium subsaxonicum WB 4.1-42 = DSM 21790 TaxID=1121898 RepID=A0A0A2MR28_9FLAO|nr:hypothetical protein [Flavobacterium subsaxonicum]KGO94789.1 hypothetical protein Q766_01360 [Flavobacterium subsaxonicum WB 4.1-42 = DSM 21790]
MSKSTKALLYNFLGFAPIYLLLYFLIGKFTNLTGWWIPVTAAVATTILAPKFQAAKYLGEEKIFMKWLFIKGPREIK